MERVECIECSPVQSFVTQPEISSGNKLAPGPETYQRRYKAWNGKVDLASYTEGTGALEGATELRFSSCIYTKVHLFACTECIAVFKTKTYFATVKIITFCVGADFCPQ